MPRLPVDVRRAGADDIDDVLVLWEAGCDELARSGRHVADAGQVRDRLLSALAADEVEVLLARWDGRLAGFLMARTAPLTMLADTPAVYVEQVFVSAELRRHGVAHALLTAVVAKAERVGAEQVVASVLPWARDMHRFFARLGFTPLVVRRVVATAALRRRLAGESSRGALEDLLSRRRSLRDRGRQVLSPAAAQERIERRRRRRGAEAQDPPEDVLDAGAEAALDDELALMTDEGPVGSDAPPSLVVPVSDR